MYDQILQAEAIILSEERVARSGEGGEEVQAVPSAKKAEEQPMDSAPRDAFVCSVCSRHAEDVDSGEPSRRQSKDPHVSLPELQEKLDAQDEEL